MLKITHWRVLTEVKVPYACSEGKDNLVETDCNALVFPVIVTFNQSKEEECKGTDKE